VKDCPQCGVSFDPATPRQKWCTPKCQVQAANARRQTTREGRKARATQPRTTATIAQLLGHWFVRVDGWLALGPLTQAQAQERADAMNKEPRK
jgi:hypothetical protein